MTWQALVAVAVVVVCCTPPAALAGLFAAQGAMRLWRDRYEWLRIDWPRCWTRSWPGHRTITVDIVVDAGPAVRAIEALQAQLAALPDRRRHRVNGHARLDEPP